MGIFIIILIAISLSMDAFSLALSFGTMINNAKKRFSISGTVGLFHFFMPLIGAFIGRVFVRNLHVQADFLEGVIFFYIAILMFRDFKNGEDEKFDISFIGIILFAFGVSLDSFGVGFTFSMSLFEMIRAVSIFAITSAGFTYLGLKLGDKLNKLVGEYSVLAGAIIMTILALINFCQLLF